MVTAQENRQFVFLTYERFEVTKVVIKSHQLKKDRQHSDQKDRQHSGQKDKQWSKLGQL
jgi:hypothetical protein